MKKILCFVLLICLAYNADAQLLGKFKRKLANKIEDKIAEKAAEEAAEEIMESIEKDMEASQSDSLDNSDPKVDLSSLFSGVMETPDIEESYTFDAFIEMEITSYEDGKKEVESMAQSFSENAQMISIETGEGDMITDIKNKAFIIIDHKEKTVQTISLKWADKMGGLNPNQNPFAVNNPKAMGVEKTGKTKMILGYNCEEYKVKAEDGHSEIWFSSEVDFVYESFISGLSKGLYLDTKDTNFSKGSVMELLAYDTKGKLESAMVVKEFSESSHSVDLKNYKQISLMDGGENK